MCGRDRVDRRGGRGARRSRAPRGHHIECGKGCPGGFRRGCGRLRPRGCGSAVTRMVRGKGAPTEVRVSVVMGRVLSFLGVRPNRAKFSTALKCNKRAGTVLRYLGNRKRVCTASISPRRSTGAEGHLTSRKFKRSVLDVHLRGFYAVSRVTGRIKKFSFVLTSLKISSVRVSGPGEKFSFGISKPLSLQLGRRGKVDTTRHLSGVSRRRLTKVLCRGSSRPCYRRLTGTVASRVHENGHVSAAAGLEGIVRGALSFLPGGGRGGSVVGGAYREAFRTLHVSIGGRFRILCRFVRGLPKTLGPNKEITVLAFRSKRSGLMGGTLGTKCGRKVCSRCTESIIHPSTRRYTRGKETESAGVH